jgi:hypothetical protein
MGSGLLMPRCHERQSSLCPQTLNGIRDGTTLITGNPKHISHTFGHETTNQRICTPHLTHFTLLPFSLKSPSEPYRSLYYTSLESPDVRATVPSQQSYFSQTSSDQHENHGQFNARLCREGTNIGFSLNTIRRSNGNAFRFRPFLISREIYSPALNEVMIRTLSLKSR